MCVLFAKHWNKYIDTASNCFSRLFSHFVGYYADDLALLINTPALIESPLHSQEPAARGICLYVNSDKTKRMWFKQDGSHLYLKWSAGPYTLAAISHQLKAISTYAKRNWELLQTGCRSCINLISVIKQNGISSNLWLCWYDCIDAPPWLKMKCFKKKLHGNYTKMLF